MSKLQLPERPSLEYLKRRAKESLAEMRRRDARAKLSAAQLSVAREYGFPSWRALKAEVDRRRASTLTSYFAACRAGDAAQIRALLATEPGLVHDWNAEGATGLHVAVRHLDAVRVLLEHGADPNARDIGDNAYPLHAAGDLGGVDVVRALLDAGGDVHGVGDVHRLEVIGWATCFGPTINPDVLALLLERGARHHIFSAIAVQDLDVIERLVEEDPQALSRRLSRFEQGQTALHYVIAPPDGLVGGGFRTGAHYVTLDLLLELGADVEAMDDRGRTPLAVATLRGDEEAMRRLKAAGARAPARVDAVNSDVRIAELAGSVRRMDAMLAVPDIRATIDWYRSIGFQLEATHEADGGVDWAGLSFGGCYLMLVPSGTTPARREVSFWFRTTRVDELYEALESRQLERTPDVRFRQDLHDAFYGEREFTLVDLNGYELTFAQSLDR